MVGQLRKEKDTGERSGCCISDADSSGPDDSFGAIGATPIEPLTGLSVEGCWNSVQSVRILAFA